MTTALPTTARATSGNATGLRLGDESPMTSTNSTAVAVAPRSSRTMYETSMAASVATLPSTLILLSDNDTVALTGSGEETLTSVSGPLSGSLSLPRTSTERTTPTRTRVSSLRATGG